MTSSRHVVCWCDWPAAFRVNEIEGSVSLRPRANASNRSLRLVRFPLGSCATTRPEVRERSPPEILKATADESRCSGVCFEACIDDALTPRGVLTSLTRRAPVALCDGRCVAGARGDATPGIGFSRASFTGNASNCVMSRSSGLATVATRRGDVTAALTSSAFVAESERDALEAARTVVSWRAHISCAVTSSSTCSSEVAEDEPEVDVDSLALSPMTSLGLGRGFPMVGRV